MNVGTTLCAGWEPSFIHITKLKPKQEKMAERTVELDPLQEKIEARVEFSSMPG